jgi:hypothetical protein
MYTSKGSLKTPGRRLATLRKPGGERGCGTPSRRFGKKMQSVVHQRFVLGAQRLPPKRIAEKLRHVRKMRKS